MGLGLQKTKRRIASVQTTKKITKAMEMIATTKLRTWRERMMETRAYTDALVEIIHEHLSGEEAYAHPLFNENANAVRNLYVVISSHLGLCGSYNHNVYQKVTSVITPEDDLVVIGSKGTRHYANAGTKIIDRYADLAIRIDYPEIKRLGTYLLQVFKEGRYRKISIIFTHYVNSMSSEAQCVDLLPLPKEGRASEEKNAFGPIIEPNLTQLIQDLVPFYVNNLIYSKLIESQIAEQSLRRFAMEQSSDNADELTEQLLLEYNKERQAAITQEIAEIVGSSGVY
jgi:F-type H+-transporting ATPase subunit gamma